MAVNNQYQPKYEFPSEIPFLRDVGAEFVKMAGGEAEITLLVQDRHCNSWGVTHGGVVMTLLDVAMSMAARSTEEEARGGLTIEMKTSFMQPSGSVGKRIRAIGRVSHRAKSFLFCDGEVWDGDTLAAKAMGTFKLVKHANAAKKLEAS